MTSQEMTNALDNAQELYDLPADEVRPRHWMNAVSELVESGALEAARKYAELLENVAKREATHTNYNTGLPCFCDTRFGGNSGPCIDADEAFAGGPWDGSG